MWEGFLLCGNFFLLHDSLPRTGLCPQLFWLSFCLLQASWLPTSPYLYFITYQPLPAQRKTARARKQGPATISAPEMASSTKLWAGSQLLTMSSWDPGWLISARRVAAWDQLSGGDIRHTCDDALMAHPGNWKARTGEVTKMHRPPGTVCLPSNWLPKCSDLGRTQNACSTHRDWARTMYECLLWGYWSAVVCRRGSGCSRLGYGISPLGGGCH